MVNSYTSDYSHHIPDAIVRKILPHYPIKFAGCIPDGVVQINSSNYIVFEYENSSRGLLTCVAKYQHLCANSRNLQIQLVLIESLFHIASHTKDFTLADFVAKSSPSNLSIIFEKCLGTEEGLRKLVKKMTKKLSIVRDQR